jgi:alpha-galactosidase
VQGHIVQFRHDYRNNGDNYDVLAKPLANGDVAVVFYNQGENQRTITTTAYLVGLKSGSSLRLKNLVSKAVSASVDQIEATVPPHGTVIYRVSAQ